MVHPAVAAFSAAETVAERLDALSRDRPRRSGLGRVAAYAPAGLITAAVLAALVAWGGEAAHLLALAGHCPT
jgi:fatty acid desaturase